MDGGLLVSAVEGGASVKMLAEYFDMAFKFEQMATAEKDPVLKAEFEKQAADYRKLAEKRAKEYGLKNSDPH
jgi:hypothetical protein